MIVCESHGGFTPLQQTIVFAVTMVALVITIWWAHWSSRRNR